jgi:hypothetical protein
MKAVSGHWCELNCRVKAYPLGRIAALDGTSNTLAGWWCLVASDCNGGSQKGQCEHGNDRCTGEHIGNNVNRWKEV